MDDGEHSLQPPSSLTSSVTSDSIAAIYASYRLNGHLSAQLDPLELTPRPR